MKRIILLSLMAFFALYSQAQFYSSEACFFIKAGEDPKKSINSWKIILFKGKEAFNFYTTRSDFEYIKNCLKKNPNYFDNKDCGDYQKKTFTYSPTSSTNSEYVYERYKPRHYEDFGYGAGYWANAVYEKLVFNKDLSTLTRYYKEGDSDYRTYYYVRVPKSEVLPVNNGFIE